MVHLDVLGVRLVRSIPPYCTGFRPASQVSFVIKTGDLDTSTGTCNYIAQFMEATFTKVVTQFTQSLAV